MKAKAFSFTHRTKVFADGTVRKKEGITHSPIANKVFAGGTVRKNDA
jgi:hypothetical protein